MNGRNFVKELYNTHPLYLPHQSHGNIFPYISIPTSRVTGWAVGLIKYCHRMIWSLSRSLFFLTFDMTVDMVLVFTDALPELSSLQVGLSLCILK